MAVGLESWIAKHRRDGCSEKRRQSYGKQPRQSKEQFREKLKDGHWRRENGVETGSESGIPEGYCGNGAVLPGSAPYPRPEAGAVSRREG